MRLIASLAAAALALVVLPAVAADEGQRAALYQEFRSAFDARGYTAALPLAERLVRITEEQFGANDLAMVNPLVNLGTVRYRLGQYDPALDNYRRSIEILEARSEKTDRQFIRALHGLGATYRALHRDDEAVIALKRAVDLSRNLDGLFNAEQLVVLRPLIASYSTLGRTEEAGKEEQYAFTVAENTYGKEDARLLLALDQYARYFESVGRYATARAVHARAIGLGERLGGRNSPLVVAGLRGVARAHRLAFLNGEEEIPVGTTAPGGFAAGVMNPSSTMLSGGPNPEGERALKGAVQLLTVKDRPVNNALLGAVLVDLGDWYLTADATERALSSYRDAWRNLSMGGSTAALEKPLQLAYRPPAASTRRNADNAEDLDSHAVRVRFTVTPRGETTEVLSAGGDASESQARAVIAAVKKARYRPRLENGEPVATANVEFETAVYTRRKEPKS